MTQDDRAIVRTDMPDFGRNKFETGQSGPVGEISQFTGFFTEQLFCGPMGHIGVICLPQELKKGVTVKEIGQETAHLG